MPTHNKFHAFYVIEKASQRSRRISSANRAKALKASQPKPAPYAVAKVVTEQAAFSS